MNRETVTGLGEPLVSTDELATFLGVSPSTVLRLACEGEIAFVRVGRGLRFAPEAVRAFVAERERRVPRLEESSPARAP
jgi:excisionase family DNA binding protein